MRTAVASLFAAVLTARVSASDASLPQNPDVSLFVEALEYRLDAIKSWGTDRAGKEEEWRNDLFRFRVIEPTQYAGAKWQVMLPSAFAEDHLARLPQPGQKLRIRIDTLSLQEILAPKSEVMNPYRWPLLQFDYVFPPAEKAEATGPPSQTRGTPAEIRKVRSQDRVRRAAGSRVVGHDKSRDHRCGVTAGISVRDTGPKARGCGPVFSRGLRRGDHARAGEVRDLLDWLHVGL